MCGTALAGPAVPTDASGKPVTETPAPSLKVVALPMNVSGAVPPACRLPFLADGTSCRDVGTAIALTPVQAGVLESLLADAATWGGDEGKCALPLHGFAWLGEDGRAESQVAVSLLCDKVEGAPTVPGQPTGAGQRGLSENGRMAFRALCVDVGLPHCHITEPGEAFGR